MKARRVRPAAKRKTPRPTPYYAEMHRFAVRSRFRLRKEDSGDYGDDGLAELIEDIAWSCLTEWLTKDSRQESVH